MLYEIVTTAEKSPHADQTPFNTLYKAYEEVLARYEIRTEHDAVYFPFITRLVDVRATTPSLYAAFESMLRERDIELDIRSEDTRDEPHEIDTENAMEEAEEATGNAPFTSGRRRERRASFSSFVDTEGERTRGQRMRAGSTGSLSKLQDHSEGFGSKPFKLANRRDEDKGKAPAHQRPSAGTAHAGRGVNPLRIPEISHRQVQPHLHRASTEFQAVGIKHNRVRAESRPLETIRGSHAAQFAIYEDPSSQEEQRPASLSPSRTHDLQLQQDLLYRPSETQLVRDADTFYHFYIRSLARRILRQWRARAKRSQDYQQKLLLQALLYDGGILLRQGFEQWRDGWRLRKQIAETEKFYGELDAEAIKARNLFLLTKAFTHWAQCAADEVERTNVARRHVVRLRYFNAWKEVTVVNEFKIRRHQLQKFFGVWTTRLDLAVADHDRAVVLYQDNVVEKVYRRWFWTICERRIDQWRSTRLKRLQLVRWAVHLQKNLNRNARVWNLRDVEVERRCLAAWSQSAQAARHHQEQAADYHQRHLVARCFPQWEMQLRLAPAARQVQGMVQWRIVSSAFSKIALRLQLARQAELVNRRRIVRNAWTQWNDRLRWQTLLHQVSDRLATQALYRWVIAERFMLMKRLHEERIRINVFQTMVDRWQAVAEKTEGARRAVASSRRRHLLAHAITAWRDKLRQQQDRRVVAFEYYAPRVRQEAIQAWHAKHEHQIQLGRWCVEAMYYFRATRSFKALQGGVIRNRKQRRRDAYAQVRRMVKMNLARNILRHWQDKATYALAINSSASDFADNRQTKLATDIVRQWHSSLIRAEENNDVVIDRDHKKLLAMSLGQWAQRLHSTEQDAEAAFDFARSRTEKAAYDCLRRLQLRTLEHHSLAAKANTVFSWSDRRRLRALLRGWADRAISKRSGEEPQQQQPQGSSSAERRRSRMRTQAAHRDSPFANPGENILSAASPPEPPISPPPSDPSLLTTRSPPTELAQSIPLPSLSAVTPLPGYLSTPSKRAARARALVPLGADTGRAAYRMEATTESFTPATGGLRDLRKSLLGRSIPFGPTQGATGGETIFEDSEEDRRRDDNVDEREGRMSNDSPVATRSGLRGSQARDGVRRSLFSNASGRISRR